MSLRLYGQMLSSVCFSQGVVGRHSIHNTGVGLLRNDIDVMAAGVRLTLALRFYWTDLITTTKLQRSQKVSFKIESNARRGQ